MSDKPQAAAPSTGDTAGWPTARQVVLATMIVLAIAAGFWMLWRFRFVALAVIAAIFLHVGMKPAVEALHKRGMRRAFGVALVYGVLVLVLAAFLLLLAPMLSAQAARLAEQLPEYYRIIRNGMLVSDIDLLTRFGRLLPPAGDSAALQAIIAQTVRGRGSTSASPVIWADQAGEALFFVVAMLAMAFYWTMDRDLVTYQLVLRLPVARRQPVRDLISELETKIGSFIRGQLILCTVIGLLSLIAYLLIGLPYAFALAVVAFFFEAIPMVGPALTAVVSGLVAASVGPEALLWTLAAGFVIQAAENNFIVPRVMDKAVGVNPVVTLLAISAFALMLGFIGALLAIPLAAMIQVFLDRYLFNAEADSEAFGNDGVEVSTGRARVDVLRAEAAELVQDVRKQMRSSDVALPPDLAAIEDLIEQAAADMVELLAAAEQPDATPPKPLVTPIALPQSEADR